MSNVMGVGIFWIILNRADLGLWRLTLRMLPTLILRKRRQYTYLYILKLDGFLQECVFTIEKEDNQMNNVFLFAMTGNYQHSVV